MIQAYICLALPKEILWLEWLLPRKAEVGEQVADVRILGQFASHSSISVTRKNDGSISAPDEEHLTGRMLSC
jgi:hypothetical protein